MKRRIFANIDILNLTNGLWAVISVQRTTFGFTLWRSRKHLRLPTSGQLNGLHVKEMFRASVSPYCLLVLKCIREFLLCTFYSTLYLTLVIEQQAVRPPYHCLITMVNQRKFLYPSEVSVRCETKYFFNSLTQTSKQVSLRARLYSPRLNHPTNISIHAHCTTSNPQNIRYPCVESVMDGSPLQSYIHDIYVRVSRPRPVLFRIFFKRHIMLPHNTKLNLQGDIIIMRVASRNRHSVVNIRTSDRHIIDAVLQKCAFIHLFGFLCYIIEHSL